MDYRNLCQKTSALVKEVGDFISGEQQKINQEDIHFKDKNDLVSYVDVEAEKRLLRALQGFLPDSEVLAEETASELKKSGDKPLWIIDPLDGTTNFLHGIPVYSISVALMVDNRVRMGVVYEVNKQEMFTAWGDGKAYLNGSEISVSETKTIGDSLIATGFPYRIFKQIDLYMNILRSFMINSRGVRRLGSAAVDLVYVACGRFDSFYEFDLNPWDVAAGAFIVQQAGGKVSDFDGGYDFIFGGEILAANAGTQNEVLKTIREQLK